MYASRVRPVYPARKPANASRPALVNAGSATAITVDGDDVVVVIGHLPDPAETRKLGQRQAPATMIHHAVHQPMRSRKVTMADSIIAPDRRFGAAQELRLRLTALLTEHPFCIPQQMGVECPAPSMIWGAGATRFVIS